MTEQHETERLRERVRGLGNQLPEIEVLEERVRDLERQLAQEQAAHLNEKEIASRRAAQFAD